MADEPNETRAFYKALADFSAIKRELRSYRRELTQTKAAEAAFNAQANKNRTAAAEAAKKRTAAIKAENTVLKQAISNVQKYNNLLNAEKKNSQASTRALQAQNRVLETNAKRLRAAAEAGKQYKDSQKRSANTTTATTAATKALRDEQAALESTTKSRRRVVRELKQQAAATKAATTSNVRFYDSIGEVDEVTGEVIESLDGATESTERFGTAMDRASNIFRRFFGNAEGVARAQEALSRAREAELDRADRLRIAEVNLDEAVRKSGEGSNQAELASLRLSRARRNHRNSVEAVTAAEVRLRKESNSLIPVQRRVERSTKSLFQGFQKFGNWRPRLIPPFVALIPIIGAVIAAINPLVAILGSIVPLALGVASSIGSLSGAFLALPGILSAVVAGIAGVIASFGGVGSVFKAYSAMQKAMGKGVSGGKSQVDRADDLARAEYNLSKAHRNVQKAQERLNKAREDALQDLIDLREEVSRASMTEERAVANLRKAQEAYWNVMAEPGSTLGDKMDAIADLKEAEVDLEDVRKQNIQNAKDLAEAERKGVEQSDKVLDAQENLTDAIWAQKDAQKALNTEQAGGAANVAALNEYNDALAKLSPSARAFVLAIIAMQDQWTAFKQDLQETFFSQFVNDLDKLPKILQNIGNFLRPATRSMGQFARSLIEAFSSDEWTRDLSTIGEQNGRVVTDLADASLSLGTALKDLVIAAGPFTEWMTGGFAEGSKNFAEFIANARETGSLARWLDTVSERMSKWWRVIKNIGSTLFNYSAAASEFGGWILDNLVEMTGGWAESAKRAREDGSPFQKWLEDIKPLLSEVNGLFGDFFGWMRQEAMDPQNIEDATDLLRIIRDDLGPALGRLLDTLAETEIDEKFVKALSSIVESLDTIMENGGGDALETFFDLIEGFFGFLADVTERIPPEWLEAVLKFVGGLAAITFVGKFTGLTKLLGAILGLGKDSVAVKLLGGLFGKFSGVSSLTFGGVLTFLGKLLKVAGVAGSIVGVLAGLADVGGKSANIVDAAMRGDAKAAQDGYTNPETGLLFTQNPLAPAGTPGANPIATVQSLAGSFDATFGTNLKEEFERFVDETMGNLADFAVDFGKGWDDFWGGIGTGWNDFWGGIGDPQTWEDAGAGLGDWLLDVGKGWDDFWGGLDIGKLWENFTADLEVQGAQITADWDSFWGSIGQNWALFWDDLKTGKLWTNIGTELQNFGASFGTNWHNFWGGVGAGFQNIVDSIGYAWNGIQNMLATPVNWVITNVWNRGIVQFWNGLASKLGWGQLSTFPGIATAPTSAPPKGRPVNRGMYAEGGVLPGYTPGRDVHDFYSPTAGYLHLSGGEAIMRPEFTRAVGGEKGVAELNRKARSGEAFASGGVYGGSSASRSSKKEPERKVDDSLWAQILAGPKNWLKGALNGAVAPWLSGIGNNDFANMVRQLPSLVIDKLIPTGVKAIENDNPTGGAADGMGWAKQWAVLKRAFPTGINLHDGGIRKGSAGYHGRGRAIDITPSEAAFNWIRKNYPNSRELIYTPMEGRQLRNGANYGWPDPTIRRMHYNHVHWAMKNGGVVPGLYDNGGWLPNGGLAINKTGKPEAVLDPQESRALKALLSGSGLGAIPALSASPGFGVNTGGGVQRIIDNSVNIQEYNVHNPTPEPASDSLPKTIRKTAYANNARTR